jgi:5-methylcytosine-specific restriction endonuclease McrA
MNQRESLKSMLIDFCNQRETRTFSLQELNNAYGDYSVIGIIGIGGRTPQATIRRLLQELRDSNFISFLDKSGHYTLRGVDFLKSELTEIENIDISKEMPIKREYLLETYVWKVKWVSEAKRILGNQCLCIGCNNTFRMDDGSEYIEVHHIIPLCCGGEDGIWNLSVLCAHHHRMAHFATTDDRIKIEKYLLKEVSCRISNHGQKPFL